MKRIFAVILALCMLLALTGCKGKCEACGKERELSKVTLNGNTKKLCDTCKGIAESLESVASQFGM